MVDKPIGLLGRNIARGFYLVLGDKYNLVCLEPLLNLRVGSNYILYGNLIFSG